MFKYTYMTVPPEIRRAYKENAKIDLDTPDELLQRAILSITAKDEDEAFDIRKAITDIRHWVLVKSEKID
jgi:hypothetical protein